MNTLRRKHPQKLSCMKKAIERIKAEKEQKRIWPTHATMPELINAGFTKEQIREAVRSGEVGFGRTINSFYFFVKSE